MDEPSFSGLLVVVSVAFAAPFDFENPEHR